jgi:hypothetical protein
MAVGELHSLFGGYEIPSANRKIPLRNLDFAFKKRGFCAPETECPAHRNEHSVRKMEICAQ